jgi:hypothetical protein
VSDESIESDTLDVELTLSVEVDNPMRGESLNRKFGVPIRHAPKRHTSDPSKLTAHARAILARTRVARDAIAAEVATLAPDPAFDALQVIAVVGKPTSDPDAARAHWDSLSSDERIELGISMPPPMTKARKGRKRTSAPSEVRR